MTSTGPAIVILALTLTALPADAADNAMTPPSIDQSVTLGPLPIVWDNVTWGDAQVSRPPELVALYVSYAALQAYDVYSTSRALARGAREANPLMRGVVGNTPGFVALKVGAGIAMVVATERLWRKNQGSRDCRDDRRQ